MSILSGFRKFYVNLISCIIFPRRETRHRLRGIWQKNSIWRILRLRYEYRHQPKEFRYYLSFVICVKDEGAYIREWIEYHLLMGVNHFYIYNNNGTDNTREIIDDYIKRGLITWHEYPGPNKQHEIYNHALNKYKNETRWMGFIDADEFVVPMRHKSLADALHDYEYASQLQIQWVNYGSSGHKNQTPGLVIERFTKHAATPNSSPKSIINPRAAWYALVHSHIVMGKTVDEHHNVIPDGRTHPHPTADILRVNHYMTKSWAEFCHKRNRGYATTDTIDDTYFTKVEAKCNAVDEPDLMTPFVRAIKKKLQGAR